MDSRHSFATKLGVGLLALNSVLAIYKSRSNPSEVAFVIAADLVLLLLFFFLLKFERAGAVEQGRTKVAVWLLTTLLTAMFASKVAPLMPRAVALTVWLMAVATAVGGFWALFLSP